MAICTCTGTNVISEPGKEKRMALEEVVTIHLSLRYKLYLYGRIRRQFCFTFPVKMVDFAGIGLRVRNIDYIRNVQAWNGSGCFLLIYIFIPVNS